MARMTGQNFQPLSQQDISKLSDVQLKQRYKQVNSLITMKGTGVNATYSVKGGNNFTVMNESLNLGKEMRKRGFDTKAVMSKGTAKS